MDFTGTYTDLYQLAMSQVYFQTGRHNSKAVFDYFFRKLPFQGGYAVFAGLESLLEILEQVRFSDRDLAFLEDRGFDKDFLKHLSDFQFRGRIRSAKEGDLIFPTRPVLQVEGSLLEAQLVETLLLNMLNFQTLIATKAARMRSVAGDHQLIDFGLRRAHATGGYWAARAAYVGGFDGTSNVQLGRDMGIPVAGTMAHSFIQSYPDELTAFRDFAFHRPGESILLVDTYDTLKSGLPNAIKIGLEMKARGLELQGIRLDSGDLAYLSKESRKMLDEAGLQQVKIAASNQLDEYVIKSLRDQDAAIDLFGVGTSLVTGQPDAALDGVYKLVSCDDRPAIKVSENRKKVTLPGKKQVYRVQDSSGQWTGADVVALEEEGNPKEMIHPFEPQKKMSVENCRFEPLLEEVMRDGSRTSAPPTIEEIRAFRAQRQEQLPPEYQRFEYPHIYKVGISPSLKSLRDRLISEKKIS